MPGEIDAAVAIDAFDDPDDPDDDDDGVLDLDDNCPTVANAGQLDEDGDGSGDACDKCPPFDDAGEDADGDGVGDLCDPNPNTGGDVATFYGFDSAPAGFIDQGDGTMTISGGDVRLAAASTQFAVYAIAAPTAARVTVSAGLTIETIGGASGFVSVIQQHQPNTDNSVACQFGNNDVRLFATQGGGVLDMAAFPVQPGTQYTIRFTRSSTAYACEATLPATTVTGTTTYAPANPEIGARVRNATARFHWILVVTSP